MITAQLKTSFILLTLFLTIAIAAKAVGSLQPINPAMRGFIEGCEDKPQPCWYGIVLNSTTIENAHVLTELNCVSNQGTFDSRLGFVLHYACNINSPIYQIDIGQPLDLSSSKIPSVTAWVTNVTVGDFVNYFGEPKQVDVDFFLYGGVFLDFGQNIYGYVDEPLGNVDLKSEVSNYSVGMVSSNVTLDWRGFIPMWRYCQLESNSRIC